jgi:hypothetical protein
MFQKITLIKENTMLRMNDLKPILITAFLCIALLLGMTFFVFAGGVDPEPQGQHLKGPALRGLLTATHSETAPNGDPIPWIMGTVVGDCGNAKDVTAEFSGPAEDWGVIDENGDHSTEEEFLAATAETIKIQILLNAGPAECGDLGGEDMTAVHVSNVATMIIGDTPVITADVIGLGLVSQ